MAKVELYAYQYEQEKDTYHVNPKQIHKFKNMKEFEETSGIFALSYFLGHPLKNLGFCYCFEGQDIMNKENIKLVSYGFLED